MLQEQKIPKLTGINDEVRKKRKKVVPKYIK